MLEIEQTSTSYPLRHSLCTVSVLFEMRDSGGFPTFHSVPSFSVSVIFADPVSIRDPTVRVSFHDNSHSYRLLFIHSLDTNLVSLSRSHRCSCTEVNKTAVTHSP